MGLTKVFVGNLSFKTKDSDLASEFSSAGRVVSANIITRGPRSLGYGFVELESEEEAQKAVALMNKKNIDTREINVELARPRDENKIAERRNGINNNNLSPGGGRGRGGRGRGFGRGRGGGRGGFGGRGRAYRPRGQSDGGFNNNNIGNVSPIVGPNLGVGSPGPVHDPSSPDAGLPPNIGTPRGGMAGRRGRGRGGRGRGGRGGQRGGFSRPFVPKAPSKTLLYVANLPFSTTDIELSDLFKDLKATSAYVVKAKNGRSKGFGFVEFANSEDQQAALQAAENFSIEGRNLLVKVAMTENRTANDESNPDNINNDNNLPPINNDEKEVSPQQDQKESQPSS